MVFFQKNANGIAYSEDPDQTAPSGARRSSLIWVFTVCPNVSVPKFRIFTVHHQEYAGGDPPGRVGKVADFQC